MASSDKRAAFTRVADELYADLYRYAYRLTGRVDQAEELTQESLLRGFEQYAKLRNPERVKPWLIQILRNFFLQDKRFEKSHPHQTMDGTSEPVSPDVPVATGLDTSGVDLLQAVLNELPEIYRSPIILYYFDDLDYRAIADLMEVPIGTVMSRLARAKEKLRERLDPHAESLGFLPERPTTAGRVGIS